MPQHSSKNYYKAEDELSDTQVSFLTLDMENEGFDYSCSCYNCDHVNRGCICSDCKELRKQKREKEIVENEFTPEQMLSTYIEHVKSNSCEYDHTLDELEKKVKQWFYKQSKNKNVYAKPFADIELHANDLPSCVVHVLYDSYEKNLQEQHKERNRRKREQKRKQKGICEEGVEWTPV